MSTKVSALCWQIPLPIADKLILLRLADYADNDGGSIFPAVATVAHFCGVSERAVQYTLKKLTEDGLLFVVGNETGGRGKTRHYVIDLERAGQLAAPSGGQSNGTGKRVQRVKKDCTLSDPAETPQRVHQSAEKGEVDLHPTLQEPSGKEEESVCDVGVSPREAHTPAPPSVPEPQSSNVVPFVPPADRQPMPAAWVLPEKWRATAADAGLATPELSALKFRDHWRDKGAVKDEAGWYSAWEWWFRKDIEWERKHGQQHHAGRYGQRQDNGLVAYAKSEMQRDPGFAQTDPDDGGWRIIRG